LFTNKSSTSSAPFDPKIPSCFYRSRTCQYCENSFNHEHQYCPLIPKTRKEIKAYLSTFYILAVDLISCIFFSIWIIIMSSSLHHLPFQIFPSSLFPFHRLSFIIFYAHKLYMMRKTKIPVNPSYFEWIGRESKD